MNTNAALLLVRPRSASATITWLQLTASGVATLLTFTVAMLSLALWRVPSDEIAYKLLAVALIAMLLVPLITLGTATARLAARSRDERLATLRLLGATTAQVRRVAVLEVTLIAALGTILGAALSAAMPYALSLISVHGEPLAAAELWLPWWVSAAIPPLLVLVAAASALLGLHQVILSPLGVHARPNPPRMSWVRLVVALAVAGVAVLVMQLVSPGWGVLVLVTALAAVVLAVMAVFSLVGPFAVSLFARGSAARTADPGRLVAARGVQDDPKAAWRSVSTLALASFILIPLGSLLGYLNTISHSQSREIMTADQLLLFADSRTILLALVAVSFLVVACQVAIAQTAAVMERRELYLALDRIGMPRVALKRARLLQVTMPSNVAVIGAVAAAVLLAFPLVGIAVAVAPLFVVAILLVLIAGLLLIRAGVAATAPVMRRVLEAPARGE